MLKMFYKYVCNILWEHFVKFEMDLMKVKYIETFSKQYKQCFHYLKNISKNTWNDLKMTYLYIIVNYTILLDHITFCWFD
jgi:hypothetical protein